MTVVVQPDCPVACTYVHMCVCIVCLDWSGKRETRASGQRPYFRVQSEAGRDPTRFAGMSRRRHDG